MKHIFSIKIHFKQIANSLFQGKLEAFLLMNIEKDILANVKEKESMQLIINKLFDWLILLRGL